LNSGRVAPAVRLRLPKRIARPDGAHRRFVFLWKEASASLREDRRRELVHEMQRLEYEYGGFLIWGFADQLDGYRSNVRGLRAGTRGMFPLDGYGRGFRAVWLS
jgi:peptide/nickel transport system substrate-binding protein